MSCHALLSASYFAETFSRTSCATCVQPARWITAARYALHERGAHDGSVGSSASSPPGIPALDAVMVGCAGCWTACESCEQAESENRTQAISVFMRVWYSTPRAVATLRDSTPRTPGPVRARSPTPSRACPRARLGGMYREHVPPAALAPYIDRLWTTEGGVAPIPRRVLPDGCIDVMIELAPEPAIASARVIVPTTRALVVPAGTQHRNNAKRFQPGAAASI